MAEPVTPDADSTRSVLEEMPREVAALLLSVGALGMVLPGMAGVPAVVAAGLVFWPKTFGPLEGWLGRKFPATHRQGLEQIRRYLRDLERRYPAQSARLDPTQTVRSGGTES